MGLMDIISGRRYHFNSEVTPVFTDIYNKINEVVTDIKNSDADSIKKVLKFLLFGSFLLLEFTFGEKGFKKQYLMKIDRDKTRKLLALFYVSFYVALKGNEYYRVKLNDDITEDDIYLIYTRLFSDNTKTIKRLIDEFLSLEEAGKMIRLTKKIYEIVLGVKDDDMPSEKLQDSIVLANAHVSAFTGAFEECILQ